MFWEMRTDRGSAQDVHHLVSISNSGVTRADSILTAKLCKAQQLLCDNRVKT
jgi:hypothetical protein